jgi:HAD superfamily hydrolase (TIGR01662 family)
MEPKTFIKKLMLASSSMIKNDGTLTNEQVFLESLEKQLEQQDIKDYVQKFNYFYDNGFSKVEQAVSKNNDIIKAIELLKQKGYRIVIATNPIFPMQAVLHRIHWAGLDAHDFEFITSYETCHYCKPNIHFYNEVLEKINAKASECIMVGNDVTEDLVSKNIGITTYLITDNLINTTNEAIRSDYTGSYRDFYEFVQSLPSMKEQSSCRCVL